MKFWKWLLKVPSEEQDWKTEVELQEDIKRLNEEILKLEKEVVHWKSISLNFRKFHQ